MSGINIQNLAQASQIGLPAGWRMIRLGDLAYTTSGTTPSRSRSDYYKGKIPWLKTGELRDGKIEAAEECITESALKETSLKLLPAGTLLVAMYGQGQTRGRTGILTMPATINQACFAILPKPEVFDTCFLQFWFRHNYDRLRQETEQRGGNQPNLNGKILNDLAIPLPPLAEQKRIVTLLDAKLAAVTAARTAAQAQLTAAQALPAAYLRSVFESEEAQRWPQRPLGNVLIQRRQMIHPQDNPQGPAIFVGLEHVESLVGTRSGGVHVEMSELTGRKPKFYEGDIVYGYLRPYLNKVWVAEFDGLCSVDQYIYTVDNNLADTEFVAWFMRSSVYLKRAPIGATPGQLPRIRTEEVAAVAINLPSITEQKQMAKAIRMKMEGALSVIALLREQLDTINKMTAALLHQAFTGDL